ncbi:MAG: hypothetical protein LWX11_10855 [Firmicutes bacterium]|nr:hypothetical protein [Bacillota bacterium]
MATPIDAGLGTMVQALLAEGMDAVIADLHIRFLWRLIKRRPWWASDDPDAGPFTLWPLD